MLYWFESIYEEYGSLYATHMRTNWNAYYVTSADASALKAHKIVVFFNQNEGDALIFDILCLDEISELAHFT